MTMTATVEMKRTRLRVVSNDGTTIAYTRQGQGPVVVLVGGALQTKSDHLMGALAPLLARDLTVVSYDRRGRGDSGDTLPYGFEREVEDLAAVIAENGGTAYVFGNSSGGALALLAASELHSVTRVAVYEVPFIPDAQLGSAAEYLQQVQKLAAANQPGRAVELFLKRIGVPALFRVLIRFTPMWSELTAVAHTLAYDARIVGDGSVPAHLKTLTAPTLALTGESGRMQQAAEALLATVPQGEHQTLQRQTHDPNPRILAFALLEFFANVNGRL
jgi:pimeloyl-ACP methyl ester carboxylesterase